MPARILHHRRFVPAAATAIFAVIVLAQAAPRTFAADGERPLVVVVDGAGDLRGCSTGLNRALPETKLEITTFPWSHGYRRVMLDQTDYKYARQQGERLAEQLKERMKQEPGRRVVVVAHSAGAAVALAAAEKLPAKSLDRLVLLAPSVSSKYNPRPAAKACKEGIDAFCSKNDVWALGVAMKLVGTTDDLHTSQAAGKVGFKSVDDKDDSVRQHFWSKEMMNYGHNGGHYGAYAPEFAKKFLLPILTGS